MAGTRFTVLRRNAIQGHISGSIREVYSSPISSGRTAGVPSAKNETATNRAVATAKSQPPMIRSVLDQPGVSSVPDEALMKDISRQRHAALTELYGRHGQRLKAMIDSVVHEEAEAGDVLQETLLQIWNEADHYSPKAGKPLGWMMTIARRRAIDRLRRRQAYSRARECYGKRILQYSQNPRRKADEEFVLNDLRRLLEKRLRTLPQFQPT